MLSTCGTLTADNLKSLHFFLSSRTHQHSPRKWSPLKCISGNEQRENKICKTLYCYSLIKISSERGKRCARCILWQAYQSAANFNGSEETKTYRFILFINSAVKSSPRVVDDDERSMSRGLGRSRSNLACLFDITQISKTDSSTKKLQMSLGRLSNIAQRQWHVQLVD